jgi:hypothetical protein
VTTKWTGASRRYTPAIRKLPPTVNGIVDNRRFTGALGMGLLLLTVVRCGERNPVSEADLWRLFLGHPGLGWDLTAPLSILECPKIWQFKICPESASTNIA